MDIAIPFFFRNKTCYCNCYVDISVDPCFVFVMLIDKELIKEFGVDITIQTDCVNIQPRIDDYTELIELREAIFDEFKTTPEFIAAKSRRMVWDELQNRPYKLPLPSNTNILQPTIF